MAAILRFGAEDLFKEDAAAEEARGQAVVEEDLDAILERAEVGLLGWFRGCAPFRSQLNGVVEGGLDAPILECPTVGFFVWSVVRVRLASSWRGCVWRAAPAGCVPVMLSLPIIAPRPSDLLQLVHDTGEAHGQAPGRMGELLGQFSVATFKTSELVLC